jgi:hypothetical protein
MILKRLFLAIILFTILYATVSFIVMALNTSQKIKDLDRTYIQQFSKAIEKSVVRQILFLESSFLQDFLDALTENPSIVFAFVYNENKEVISHTFAPLIPYKMLERLPYEKESSVLSTEEYGKIFITSIPLLYGRLGYLVVGQKVPDLSDLWTELLISRFIFFFIYLFLIHLYLFRQVESRISQSVYTISYVLKQVTTVISKMNISSHKITEGASTQLQSLQQTSLSLKNILSIAQDNFERSQTANTFMLENTKLFENATQEMETIAQAMEEITSSGEQVENISRLIDDIAFQTNLLALNAAVEAARVGKVGAGFSVVAEEIRTLALRSTDSAKDTQKLIVSIIDKIENGEKTVDSTQETIQQVVKVANQVRSFLEKISRLSEEQSHNIENIERVFTQLDRLALSNANFSAENLEHTQELAQEIQNLVTVVLELNQLVRSSPSPINPSKE